jgi:hypothetical protein
MALFTKKTTINCYFEETGQEIRVSETQIKLGDILAKFSVDNFRDIYHGYVVMVYNMVVRNIKILHKSVFEFAINGKVVISRRETSTMGNPFLVNTDVLLCLFTTGCHSFPLWDNDIPRSFETNQSVITTRVVYLKKNNKMYTYDRIKLLHRMVNRVPLQIPGLKKQSQEIQFNLNLSALLCIHKSPLVIIDVKTWETDNKWSRFMYPCCEIPRSLERL